ncbi:hypothetical protein RJ641_008178 [Dillenia turbinata]|uniref:beta-glucosidase n=1 Tax=Dillenia turbinata TaxID=194707 RepID=A0AAN8Z4R1_9MAGN
MWRLDISHRTTILTAVRNTVAHTTNVVYYETPDSGHVKAEKFDYAIVVVGKHSYAEGRSVVIEPYVARIDELVAAWLPGTEGQGVTDVLFGDYGSPGS